MLVLFSRRWSRVLVHAFGLVLLSALAACNAPLLANVDVSTAVITPNGGNSGNVAVITYQINQPALVSIVLTDSAGKEYPLRNRERRLPGPYEARFSGTYAPDQTKPGRRVLPNGQYALTVTAEGENGTAMRVDRSLEVRDADTSPPLVQEVSVLPEVFSPNADGVDDEALISYTLTKDAWVTVFVESKGVSFLLEPETEKIPRLYPIRWDGTAGDRLLADGVYTLRIQARDAAGNVTEATQPLTVRGAGRPMLEVTAARFTPLAVPLGGAINVQITVKNTGDAPLRSLGPDSGAAYDTIQNFNKFKAQDGQPLFYERPGFWRVGVQWEQADRPYPVRWGWGDRTLMPGEEVTVGGPIQVVGITTPYVQFWSSVVQEGVGFPGGAVGHKRIAISY